MNTSRRIICLIILALAMAGCGTTPGGTGSQGASAPTAAPNPTTAPTTVPALSPPPPSTTPAPAEEGVETLYVAPSRALCEGMAPMECMQISPTREGPWIFFYGEIDGFSYEPGYLYELRVRREAVANAPADGAAERLVLVEQMRKTPLSELGSLGESMGVAGATPAEPASALAGTTWSLINIAAGQNVQPALGGVQVTIQFSADGRVSGFAGCNNYTGAYSLSGETISVGPLASTRKACQAAGVMQQEQQVLEILNGARQAVLADETLTITDAAGQSLVFRR